MDLETQQWKLIGDIVALLEPFVIAITFFSYEEKIPLFAVLHGLLDKLEPNEYSASDSNLVKDFKEIMTS